MKLFNLCVCRIFRFATAGKNIGDASDSLTHPCAGLVRMHLVLRGNLLDRLVATKREVVAVIRTGR